MIFKDFNKKSYSIIVYIAITLLIFKLIGVTDITNYWIAVIILIFAYFFNRESLHEFFIGINLIVFVLYFVISSVLQANPPIVSVVSCSMAHVDKERTEVSHYKWLEEKFNYSREFIDRFPFKNGFLPGDVVIIKKEKNYKVGDIIVFNVENSIAPIIHRVIYINEDGTYQTKGDNNMVQLNYEYSIKNENIVGKAIFIIPKLGYLKLIFTKLLGISGVTISC